eukprot:CAMPEP_0174232638 /NCGR_PEP_ID=MMETSP0417-20130205/2871_1 /TAXON_ID=242541 /ORGANISM="Mayorella sp, Strain BSH-02190019" /LENGTH=55 /DNA_ID=CAMNT_0015310719 /DNA_START=66 /DNA_END=230 /DNA_ORIENTATION=+
MFGELFNENEPTNETDPLSALESEPPSIKLQHRRSSSFTKFFSRLFQSVAPLNHL